MALTQAIVAQAEDDEIWLAVNNGRPEQVAEIAKKFPDLAKQQRLVGFSVPGPQQERIHGNAWRARAAELVREAFLHSLKPDLVLVCSLFEGWMDDVTTSIGALSLKPLTAVIHYDLIPWLNPGAYLSSADALAYYERKLSSLKRADLLLAISAFSRLEAIDALKLPEDKVVTILGAADGQFYPQSLSTGEREAFLQRYEISLPFVMCSPGGFDSRKNLPTLVEAFAALPSELRARHQLVISGAAPETVRRSLVELGLRAGLPSDALVFVGHVVDEDLVKLYGQCELFVFPSLQEGFGLPALEAMCCGAPTIGSSTTSLPEVIGWDKAMFDPTCRDAIERSLLRGLSDPDFREALRRHAMQQARRFSWDISASRVLKACRTMVHGRARSSTAHAMNPQARYQVLLNDLTKIQQDLRPGPMDFVKLAQAIAENEATVANIIRPSE